MTEDIEKCPVILPELKCLVVSAQDAQCAIRYDKGKHQIPYI